MRPALRLVSDNFGAGPGGTSRPFGKPGNGHHRKPTILVVEDDVLIRLSVAEYLRTNNYRVLEASNVAEAKAIFKAGEPIEVVFSDVDMPGDANGFDLSQWIRREYPDVNVLLTSDAAAIMRNTGYGQESGPLLQKPYTFELLLTYIKRMLR
jgi:DNA-binding NtrC family response regulator